MFQEQREQPEQPKPPCAVCTRPAEFGFWGTQLCGHCFGEWNLRGPKLHDAELAHADAHPEDVAARGTYRYTATGSTDDRWVMLKGGVTARLAKSIAEAWMKAERAKAQKPRAA